MIKIRKFNIYAVELSTKSGSHEWSHYVSGRAAVCPHPAPYTVFACHHVFLVSFHWTSSLALFCLSGQRHFWQSVVMDHVPQFRLVWCFFLTDTGCVFLSGVPQKWCQSFSVHHVRRLFPSSFLRCTWHTTLHKFKVTSCWFGTFIYCEMIITLWY